MQSPFGAPLPVASCRHKQWLPTATGSVALVVGSSYVIGTHSCPVWHSASRTHGSHVLALIAVNDTHVPVLVSHPCVPSQSELLPHSTQLPLPMSHTGVALKCVQSDLDVQPTHVCDDPHAAAVALVQSVVDKQPTHVCVPPVSHTNVVPEQSPLVTHPTHVSLPPDTRQCGVEPEHVPPHAARASVPPSPPPSDPPSAS